MTCLKPWLIATVLGLVMSPVWALDADELIGKQRYPEALSVIEQNLIQEPNNPEWLLKRAIVWMALGRDEQAQQQLEQLQRSYPEHPAPYINLAALHAKSNRLEQARALLLQALQRDESLQSVRLSLGNVYLGLAYEQFQTLGALDPTTQARLKAIELALKPPANAAAQLASAQRGSAARAAAANPFAVPTPSATNTASAPNLPVPANPPVALMPPSSPAVALVPPPAASAPAQAMTAPLVAYAPAMTEELLLEFLDEWRQAWESRDPKAYLAYYGQQFQPHKASRQQWEVVKRRRIQQAKFIRVELAVEDMSFDSERVIVVLRQHYRSKVYRDHQRKQLVLAPEAGQWRIIEETKL